MKLSEVRVWAGERREKLFVVLSVVLLVGMAGGAVVAADGGVVQLGVSDLFFDDYEDGSLTEYTETSNGGGIFTSFPTGGLDNSTYLEYEITQNTAEDNGQLTHYRDTTFSNGSFNISYDWFQTRNDVNGGNYLWLSVVVTDGTDEIRFYHRSELAASGDQVNTNGWFIRGGVVSNTRNTTTQQSWDWSNMNAVFNASSNTVYLQHNGTTVASTTMTGSWSEPDNLTVATRAFARYDEGDTLVGGFDNLDVDVGNPPSSGGGGGGVPQNESLELDVRYYMQPNSTYPLSVYHYPDNFTREEVTNSSTIQIENVTYNGSPVITYNASGQTVRTNSNLSVAETLNITATYDTGNGTVNDTQNVVVAAPTVENLAILPNGLIRTQAVLTDGTLQALLVAALLSVPAARFTNAFAGLAVAEVVVVIGWLAGYTTLGIAMLSVFMAMFVGLNLAANIDYAISRGT